MGGSTRYGGGIDLLSSLVTSPSRDASEISGSTLGAPGAGTEEWDRFAGDLLGEAGDLPSDEELTALALDGDPNDPLAVDAVPIAAVTGSSALPVWYMPAVVMRTSARWHRPLIYAVIAAFLIVDAFGLCSTYG